MYDVYNLFDQYIKQINLRGIEENQRRVSLVFKLVMFFMGDYDSKYRVLIEHPGHLLYDGGGQVQVSLLQQEEVTFIKLTQR